MYDVREIIGATGSVAEFEASPLNGKVNWFEDEFDVLSEDEALRLMYDHDATCNRIHERR